MILCRILLLGKCWYLVRRLWSLCTLLVCRLLYEMASFHPKVMILMKVVLSVLLQELLEGGVLSAQCQVAVRIVKSFDVEEVTLMMWSCCCSSLAEDGCCLHKLDDV